jgi:aminoglycoside/choline kinase family phosphotransferase
MTEIADSIDELTPAWFTGALQDGGTIVRDAEVVAADTRVIGTGQLGFVALAELTYSAEDPAHAGPASVIVKLPSADAGSRQMGSAMGLYESEVRFYQQIAPRLGIAVPTVYWSDVEPGSGRFTVVIEDLSTKADVGDMVGGGTLEQAELAVGVLPELQAPIWNERSLTELPWAGVAKTEMLFGAVLPAIDAFAERFGERLDPAHIQLAKRLAPKAAGSAQRLWQPPYVITHGDYRLDNMMFGREPEAEPITVIDWQACRIGPPLLDAAIFMGSCMAVEVRRAEQDRLLHDYHDRLVAAGIEDFSFNDVRESYRLSSLYPFLVTIPASVMLQRTERGDQMWAQMFSNSACIVQDTHAAALLD